MAGAYERAVRRDLKRLPLEDRQGGVAQVAVGLAKRLDGEWMSSRDMATVSERLHVVLLTLAKKQEPAAVLDPVDELAKRRRQRRLGHVADG